MINRGKPLHFLSVTLSIYSSAQLRVDAMSPLTAHPKSAAESCAIFSGTGGEGVWDLHFNPGLFNVCPLTIWARHHFNGMYSDKANKVSG